MMKKIIGIALLMSAVLLSPKTYSQVKIGYISPDEVMYEMPEISKADSALGAFQKLLENDYIEQENQLNDAVAKFIKDSITMNASLKEIKRTDLQGRVAALNKKKETLNKSLDDQKEVLMKPIREKLLKAIKDVAKENGYNNVFYKEQVIIFPEADDLTAPVKKKLGIK